MFQFKPNFGCADDFELEIDVRPAITNFTANVTSFYNLKNISNETVGVTFCFPLDDSSAVYYFEIIIKESCFIASCRDRHEAEAIYETAVDSGRSAALMVTDESTMDRFSMRITNIPPKETVRLTLKYFQNLTFRKLTDTDGVALFVMPTVLNCRYKGEKKLIPNLFRDSSYTFINNLVLRKYILKAEINSNTPINKVSSERDEFLITYLSTDQMSARVELKDEFIPDHDLQMEIAYKERDQLMVSYEEGIRSETGILSMDCLSINWMPNFHANIEELGLRTEIVFLIDRSGSMQGSRISYARESLLLLLKSLPVHCLFDIVGFGKEPKSLFSKPVPFTEETLERALAYQRDMEANMGGTKILSAFQLVYSVPILSAAWRKEIIILTDGEVSNTNEVIGLVRSNSSTVRVSAIGLGEGASTALVSGVARAGKGLSTFVRSELNLRQAVMRSLECALTPWNKDVSLNWNLECVLPSGQMTPLEAFIIPSQPDAILCDNLFVASLFFNNAEGFAVRGSVELIFNRQEESIKIQADVPSDTLADINLPLHRLAVKRQISELYDEYSGLYFKSGYNHNEVQSILKKIITLSTSTNLISPFTAFVAVDPVKRDIIKYVHTPFANTSSNACFGGTSNIIKHVDTPFANTSSSMWFGATSDISKHVHSPFANTSNSTCFGGTSDIFKHVHTPFANTSSSMCFGATSDISKHFHSPFANTSNSTCFGGTSDIIKHVDTPFANTSSSMCFGATSDISKHVHSPFANTSNSTCFGGTSDISKHVHSPFANTSNITCFGGTSGSFSRSGMAPMDVEIGSGLDHSDHSSTGAMLKIDLVSKLAELHNFAGFWDLTKEFSEAVEWPLEDIRSSCPSKIVSLGEAVWATLIALAALLLRARQAQSEWNLISKKSRTWLGAQLSPDEIDQLITTALNLLSLREAT